MQVYFSFINNDDIDFEEYALQVDNYSASTIGGDMYLDDIRIYMVPPRAEVKQKTYTCGNNSTLIEMCLEWDRLLSRMGKTEQVTAPSDKDKYDSHISFCFVDSATFHQAWKENDSEANKKQAFTDAVVKFAYPLQSENADPEKSDLLPYGKLIYSTHFTSNPKYDNNDNVINIQESLGDENTAKTHLFYDQNNGAERSLAADVYAMLNPFHTYYLVLESPYSDNIPEGAMPEAERFADFYNQDPCAIQTTFQIESQGTIRINGDLLKPDATYCADEVLDFRVQLQADLDGKGTKPIDREVCCDWFFGTQDAYEATNNESKISIRTALQDLRSLYPNTVELKDWKTENNEADKQKKALLQQLVTNKKLALNQPKLNFRLSGKQEFSLVASIIPQSVRLEEGEMLANICAEPIAINLKADGQSPVACVGFHDVTYPDEGDSPDKSFRPVVRIGKRLQLDNINSTAACLNVPLKNIVFSDEDTDTSNKEISFADSYQYVYLIDSNDPKLLPTLRSEGFTDTYWPVATIASFNAKKDGKSDNYLNLYFDKTLATTENKPAAEFREGFWYTLQANFIEKTTTTDPVTNNCGGNLVFDLKVVPEYLRWTGSAESNWNNDRNWKRSSANELYKTIDKDTYDKDYDYSSSTYGFVPMRFTNVTLPENGQIQLYTPKKKAESNEPHTIWDLSTNKVSDAPVYQVRPDGQGNYYRHKRRFYRHSRFRLRNLLYQYRQPDPFRACRRNAACRKLDIQQGLGRLQTEWQPMVHPGLAATIGSGWRLIHAKHRQPDNGIFYQYHLQHDKLQPFPTIRLPTGLEESCQYDNNRKQ